MRRILWGVALLLASCLLFPASSFAQAYVRYDNVLLSARGLPLAGATVAVCTQPAVTTTKPCSPLALVYSDNGGTSLLNPLTADAFGNYHFYVSPATCGPGSTGCTVQWYGSNIVAGFNADQTPNAGTGCGLLPTAPSGVPEICVSTPSGGVAGAGAFALAGVPIDARLTTVEAMAATNRGQLVTLTNGGATALTIPQAGTSFAINNFSDGVCNLGVGLVTFTPGVTSQINGAASVALPQYWCGYLYSDNANYQFPEFVTLRAFPATTGAQPLSFNSVTGQYTVCSTCLVGTQVNSVATNFDANVTATAILNAPATQMYEIPWYIFEATAGAGCGAGSNTAALTIAWTDANSIAETLVVDTFTISANGTAGANDSGVKTVLAKSGTNITFSVVGTLASAGCSPKPQYQVYAKALN